MSLLWEKTEIKIYLLFVIVSLLTHSDATRICLSLVREMSVERGLPPHAGGECVY